MHRLFSFIASAFIASQFFISVVAEEFEITEFETKRLSDQYFSEGANAGDLDGDGVTDVVCGPYWYRGPSYAERFEIYPPVEQDRNRYADNFFSWIYDFDGNGKGDVLVVGFPGTPAFVYQNPSDGKSNRVGDLKSDPLLVDPAANASRQGHWSKHQILDWVSNESPQFLDLTGDEIPELVCTRDGFFGFATFDPNKPFEPWEFHPISERIAPPRFGHGLGVGDVNGDGRLDLLFSGGWFEQPEVSSASTRWKLHAVAFSTSYGGADMYAYDVDGDGDNDVLTSHAAHDFGLGWYENQGESDGEIQFKHHLIMGDQPSQNRYGLVISELHSVALTDVDGDGLKDLVTGKTYWSHHRQSPMWDAPPSVYWFRLTRNDEGVVDWVPHLAGDQSGIGRQLSVCDLNQDALPDFVVGGMKGTHVLIQKKRVVDRETWEASQPKVFVSEGLRTDRGEVPKFNEQGYIPNAVEAESMEVLSQSSGSWSKQDMTGFASSRWSGDAQLFWKAGEVGAELNLGFEVATDGVYDLAAVFTIARDYPEITVAVDNELLSKSLDLYHYPDVKTTGLVSLGVANLRRGKHQLTLSVTGENASAIPAKFVGFDCLVLLPEVDDKK